MGDEGKDRMGDWDEGKGWDRETVGDEGMDGMGGSGDEGRDGMRRQWG